MITVGGGSDAAVALSDCKRSSLCSMKSAGSALTRTSRSASRLLSLETAMGANPVASLNRAINLRRASSERWDTAEVITQPPRLARTAASAGEKTDDDNEEDDGIDKDKAGNRVCPEPNLKGSVNGSAGTDAGLAAPNMGEEDSLVDEEAEDGDDVDDEEEDEEAKAEAEVADARLRWFSNDINALVDKCSISFRAEYVCDGAVGKDEAGPGNAGDRRALPISRSNGCSCCNTNATCAKVTGVKGCERIEKHRRITTC